MSFGSGQVNGNSSSDDVDSYLGMLSGQTPFFGILSRAEDTVRISQISSKTVHNWLPASLGEHVPSSRKWSPSITKSAPQTPLLLRVMGFSTHWLPQSRILFHLS